MTYSNEIKEESSRTYWGLKSKNIIHTTNNEVFWSVVTMMNTIANYTWVF